ncbi:MAG: YbjN domain-containing protein [Hyphomicrobiales bacterium]|nr:YbjN domain-containing protein [Hyphomicrobiales bacterium]MCP5372330.1 YbjN domain-containing protein [Hyphomicrobiales bacterium]
MVLMASERSSLLGEPLDVIEQIVDANDWDFDRPNDRELTVQVPGRWCDYSLYFAWNADMGAMHFTCAFDLRVPGTRRRHVHELLALINEKMWLGHFGMWDDEGLPMFRHALPLRGIHGASSEQMEDLVDTAIIECDRFYPAFQYVVWGGKTAADAINASLIETVGEA